MLEFTVPYVVPGLCANPAKYSWINLALKSVRGYLATIFFRDSGETDRTPSPAHPDRRPNRVALLQAPCTA